MDSFPFKQKNHCPHHPIPIPSKHFSIFTNKWEKPRHYIAPPTTTQGVSNNPSFALFFHTLLRVHSTVGNIRFYRREKKPFHSVWKKQPFTYFNYQNKDSLILHIKCHTYSPNATKNDYEVGRIIEGIQFDIYIPRRQLFTFKQLLDLVNHALRQEIPTIWHKLK